MDRPTRPKPNEYRRVERPVAEYVIDLEEYATWLEGQLRRVWERDGVGATGLELCAIAGKALGILPVEEPADEPDATGAVA